MAADVDGDEFDNRDRLPDGCPQQERNETQPDAEEGTDSAARSAADAGLLAIARSILSLYAKTY